MERLHVMGIDIAKGSPLSKTNPPYYAVVILDENEKIIYETSEAPLKRIVRLAWEYRVQRIGVDNVYELVPSSRAIAKLLSLLPDNVELYQVTLEDGIFTNLKSQVSKLGIELASKPRPLQTAYLCALLALHKVGTPIRAIEYRTRIIVSRARSVGAGGSSANRYARGMRGAVLRMVRNIKERLDRAALNYDLIFRKGSGGLDSAVFIVYAPRSALKGLIKPVRGNDVRVVIRPEYKSIVFLEETPHTKKNLVIVGIDPGIETGLAIVDLSLRPLLVESSKELDRASIVNKIYSIGIPVMIATDKNPPPETVKKIASTLGVPLYVPSKSLSVAEKEQLIEWLRKRCRTELKIETTHERDALAAAVKAYKSYERKFLEIERKIKELGLDVDLDELKLMIMKGKSVDEAIEYALESYINEVLSYSEPNEHQRSYLKQYQQVVEVSEKERIKTLEKRIEELIRERERLRERIGELEKRIEELEFELRYRPPHVDEAVYRDRIVAELKERLRQLQNYVQSLENEVYALRKNLSNMESIIIGIALGKYMVIPKVTSLTASELQKVRELAIQTRAIFVDTEYIDVSTLKDLKSSGIVVILNSCSGETKKLLMDRDIPIVCKAEPVYAMESIALFDRNHIQELIQHAYQDLEQYKESKRRSKEFSVEDLLRIVEEYRKEIRKGLGLE